MVEQDQNDDSVRKVSRRSLMAVGAALAGSAGLAGFSDTASAHGLMGFEDAFIGDDAEKTGLGSYGWLYFAEDTGTIYKHDGSGWVETGLGGSSVWEDPEGDGEYTLKTGDSISVGSYSTTNQSSASVYLSSDQSITAGTDDEVVQFDTVEWDNLNEFDTSSHEFVASEAGTYDVKAGITFSPSSNDTVRGRVKVNGTTKTTRLTNAVDGDYSSISLATTVQLSAGDSVTIEATNKDSDDTIQHENRLTEVQIHKIA